MWPLITHRVRSVQFPVLGRRLLSVMRNVQPVIHTARWQYPVWSSVLAGESDP